MISGKDIGKYQARKSGNIRPRNWDTSEKKKQGTSSNRDTLGKQIRKHQAKKSGNIRQRNRETSGKESRNFGSSGKLGLGGAVAGSSPGKSTSSGSYLPAEELSVPRMKIFLGSR